MPTPNIVLTRIDNRLVHGQVGNVWVKSLDINLIIVVDDYAANDPIQQSLMKMTAETVGVDIRFFSLEKAISTINKAGDWQKLFIVAKTPEIICSLIEGGIPIKEVDVGNMQYSDGKHEYKEPHVYVDDKDIDDFEKMKKLGVKVYIQIVPNDHKINL